jgi:hypothetical protein
MGIDQLEFVLVGVVVSEFLWMRTVPSVPILAGVVMRIAQAKLVFGLAVLI